FRGALFVRDDAVCGDPPVLPAAEPGELQLEERGRVRGRALFLPGALSGGPPAALRLGRPVPGLPALLPEGFQVTGADGAPGMPFLALFLPGMFVLGACLGSFFNVLIYRLPREESIVLPASRCPSCGRPIRPAENIPLLGFLLLRGRCAGCGNRISWRYPGVEALTGAGFALLDGGAGTGFTLARDLVFFSLLVPIVFIDIDHRIIPDELSLGGL